MITIVDYNCGNIKSVTCALNRLGAEYELTSDPAKIAAATKLIMPGVGNATQALVNLRAKGLDTVIKGLRKPVLGICVGMQIMCRHCEEGDIDGLGLFDCSVNRFHPTQEAKVPHMGWNGINNLESKLFKGVEEGSNVYFVHSFYPGLCCNTVATSKHGNVIFSAALKYENFYGTQFHPEKSGSLGEKILANFLAL